MGSATPTLTWFPDAEGYAASGYRIRRVEGSSRYRWRLEVRSFGARDGCDWTTGSLHRTMRSARFRADGIARERFEHERITVRSFLGAASLFAFFFIGPRIPGFTGLAIWVMTLGFGFRLLIDALAIHVLASQDGPKLGPVDRLVIPLVLRVKRRAMERRRPVVETRVRVLPYRHDADGQARARFSDPARSNARAIP